MTAVRTRRLRVGAAAVAAALAVALALLAVDVLRSSSALAGGDARYRSRPAATGLWTPGKQAGGVARTILGVDDDLAFREAVRALRLSQRDRPSDSSPEAVLRRARAQELLQEAATTDPEPARRSRALNLLSVLLLSTPSASQEERAAVLKAALASLAKAIELDPGNTNAKYNLEVTLRRQAGVQQVQGGPSPNPSEGQGDSRGAATGPPGRGY